MNFKYFVIFSLVDTLLPSIALSQNSNKSISVDVGRAAHKNIRISIPEFASSKPSNSPQEEYKRFNDKLSELMGFYDFISILPEASYIAKKNAAHFPMNYEEWSSIRSDYVVFGKYDVSMHSQNFTIDLRLFDISKKKIVLGKRYSNISNINSHKVIRRFADLCIQAITGEIGIFSTKIAFVASPSPKSPRQVYIANFDGSNPQKVSTKNAIHMTPAWSPDGSKLLFTSFESGKAEIYIYNMITKRTVQLTKSVGSSYGGSWHPFSPFIAFSSSRDGSTVIETVKTIDGSSRKILVSESRLDIEPSYSPDGKFLAYSTGRFGRPHIVIRDLQNKSELRMTHQGWYNSSPAWRPDGKKIAFSGLDKEIGSFDIFMANFNSQNFNEKPDLERLTLGNGENQQPSWSPDGRFIIFQSTRDAPKKSPKDTNLYVMSKDGHNQKLIKIPLENPAMPSWGPRISEL